MNRYEILAEYKEAYSQLEEAENIIKNLPNYITNYPTLRNIEDMKKRLKDNINNVECLIKTIDEYQ